MSTLQIAALLLRPRDREAVLGDLEESNETKGRAILEILNFAIRQQLLLWTNWRPWLAAFGLALPASFLLMGFSVAISLKYTTTEFTDTRQLGLLACQALLLTGWAWTGGFVVGSLSRQTLWVSTAAALLPCLFCLSRFSIESLPRLCLLLFLLPAVWGVRVGFGGSSVTRHGAIVLAILITALTLAARSPGSQIQTLLLIWPTWFLVAKARKASVAAMVLFALLGVAPSQAAATDSQLVSRELHSRNFSQAKIPIDATRQMVVYLPPGYSASSQRYPVIYYLPSPFDTFRADFDKRDAQSLLDRAIGTRTIDKFIFVSVDMTTPLGCSWYVNSSVTGNWEDFMIQELVPYIDANFQTLPARDSRGIAGDFMGAYGAIRFGMKHPDVFGTVYGLHPVGTGSGVQVMYTRPNWDVLTNAKSLDDVKKNGVTTIFASIYQAHVPNPEKPPLFIDLQAQKAGDRLVVDSAVTERLRHNFFLEEMIPQYAANLKSLRGFKFDWARNDSNFDHVYSNQALTRKLNEFGVPHEADEYNGSWGDGNWGPAGRVYTDVLPFFGRHLVFSSR
ncbi:MAG: alpha/beta hydrolase-fold protein [Bryobacteraceae bacterium]